MIPATIYITEDYGVSHFADIDGNFPGIYSDNKLYYHDEGDFRGTSTTTIILPNTPGPSQRQARVSFGAFRRNSSVETITGRRRSGQTTPQFSLRVIKARLANRKIGEGK